MATPTIQDAAPLALRGSPPRVLSTQIGPRRSTAITLLAGLWAIIFFASLFAPPLLDDADGTHASAARHMALSGDWVTLQVDGVRYLEKAPLPYWLDAIAFRLFGFNTFAAHLPQALAVLLLALLGYRWAAEAFERQTALYTGLAVLTSAGVFLFTRIFIPEVLLSLLLCTALFLFLKSLELDPAFAPAAALRKSGPLPNAVIPGEGGKAAKVEEPVLSRSKEPAVPSTTRLNLVAPYAMWAALAFAVLTKGLVALVFFFGAVIAYLLLTGDWRRWRLLKPFSGLLLLLAIAAPWHILAGLRNTGGANGHGFFWFYFVNEHFLRFLGKRIPMDYNKLPGYLFWSLHLVWLFPWSLFLPIAALLGLRRARTSRHTSTSRHGGDPMAAVDRPSLLFRLRHLDTRRGRTTLLLILYSALILGFFSLSTNQEYYTFPAYLPLLLLTAAALTRAEQTFASDPPARHWVTVAHVTFTVLGAAAALTLAWGLWSSRHLPFVPDIGDLLAHRSVGNYTLSMSHFFDLTGPSFAALRLPAVLAAAAFAFGPAIAWLLRQQRRHFASTVSIGITSAIFLVAAHIALVRFEPMLSSQDRAEKIQELEDDGNISRDNRVLLFGDQAFGSSIPFYLGRTVDLVDGRSSSMLFGSTFPDAPHIFLTPSDLLAQWGHGERKILFIPLEKRDEAEHFLRGTRTFLLEETSGKALLTDRPLDRQPTTDPVHHSSFVDPHHL